MNAAKYVVLDLETTGLDPKKDQILEVGAIAVDASLGELDRFHRVVHFNGFLGHSIVPFVLSMHEKSNLWNECQSSIRRETTVDSELARWLEVVAGRGIVLMGNSVHFDQAFIKERFPETAAHLSHRVMDIGGLARWLGDFGIDTGPSPYMPHRGLLDAEIELREAVRDLISGRHGTVRFFTPANEPWHPGGIPAVVADFERRVEFWHQTEVCK